MPRHSPYALLSLNYFCILISIYSVLVYAWIAVYHTCSFLAKLFLFTLFYGKTWFRISRLILFPFTFVCHVCHTNSFELIWIHLIRFSMNVRLTSSLSFTVTWSSIKYLWNLTILSLTSLDRKWWAWVDSNHRPRAYQARALTSWATSPQAVPVPYSLLLQLSSGAFTRSHALTLPYSVKSLRFPLQFCFKSQLFGFRLQLCSVWSLTT